MSVVLNYPGSYNYLPSYLSYQGDEIKFDSGQLITYQVQLTIRMWRYLVFAQMPD